MLAAFLLCIAGLIHLLPLSGVMGRAALARLYGVEIGDPDLLILMQHRAVLFALLGGLMIHAAFAPSLRGLAVTMGLVSTVSFIAIALASREGTGESLRTVVYADIVAIVALTGAGLLTLAGR